MKVVVRIAKSFKKEAKPLLKKYPSLKEDLLELEGQLILNPRLGTPLGNNAFKIRLSIKSKGKGKSGGARVISYLETELIGFVDQLNDEITTVNLISIFDKSDADSISDSEIRYLIENLE